MYNYFTHVSNDVWSLQLMNIKLHELSYSLIDVAAHH